MKGTIYLLGIFFFAGANCAEDDSFAGSFLTGKRFTMSTQQERYNSKISVYWSVQTEACGCVH